MKSNIRRLCETALLLALATLLSFLKIDLPTGGGITACSMLPLIIICWRYGTGWGLFSAFTYSVLQLFFGLDNVRYATSTVMALGIILLDYIVAYSVLGFSAVFRGRMKNEGAALITGIAVTFFARFLCHFVTGAWIWNVLWPNEAGMAATVYSAVYNGWYMTGELVLTCVVASAIRKPLGKYFTKPT